MLTTPTILMMGIGGRARRAAAIFLSGAALFGCDAGSSVGTTPTGEGIRLDQSTVRMDEGSSVRLRVLSQGQEMGGQFVWSVRDPDVASVSDGLVTALRPGVTRVTATLGGKQTASADVYVLAVPGSIEILAGAEQVGTVGEPLAQPIELQALNRQGVPIAGARLLLTASGNGTVSPAQITTDADGRASAAWTLGTKSGPQTVDVRIENRDVAMLVMADALPDEVVQVDVSPVDAQTNPGGKVRFTAVPRDQYGNPVDTELAWSVTDESIASISADGTVTAQAEGITEVEATVAGTGTVAERAGGPPDHAKGKGRVKSKNEPVPGQVLDLSVAGTTSTTVALSFTEISDGTGYPARYEMRYAVSPIRNSFPTATTVSEGSCAAPVIGTAVGARRTCTVEGLAAGVTYDFQIIAFREIPGETLYGAESNVATGTTSSAAQPTTLEVVSGAAQVGPAGSLLPEPLVVRVRDAAGAPMQGITVKWTPASGSGSVSASETTTNSVGTTQVQWTLGPLAGSHTVKATVGSLPAATFLATAQAGEVATVTISPAQVSVERGKSVALTANAADSNGNPVEGLVYTWTSDAPGTATVSSSGQVTGVAAGQTVVRASAGGKQAAANVTVTDAASGGETPDGQVGVVQTLETVTTTPNTVALQFVEVDDGTGNPANYQIRYYPAPMGWNWGVATPVSQGSCAGKVTGTQVGALRTCTVEGLNPATTYDFQLISYRGTIGVDVVYAPSLSNTARATTLASGSGSVSIAPDGGTLTAIATTLQLSATAKDASGSVVSSPGINWTSSNDAVATVDGNGKVTAKGAGTALITAIAACCGSDVVTITVAPYVASVSVSPPAATLSVNGSLDLDATPRDANGYPVQGTGIQWGTSDATIATVDTEGNVRGLKAGTTQVRATANGVTGVATLSVEDQASNPVDSGYPNQPLGFATLAEVDFSLSNGSPWRYTLRNCCYRQVADGGAPSSPSDIGRAEYREGYSNGGVEPFALSSPYFPSSTRELYIAFWLRLSDNWLNHPSGVSKIFHVWTGRSNVIYLAATGRDYGTLSIQARTQPSPSTNRNLEANLAPATFERGRWVFIEWVLRASSGVYVPDGESHIWVDGVKVSEQRDVVLAVDPADLRWSFMQWAATYGGVASGSVPTMQYMDIDHIYVSGR